MKASFDAVSCLIRLHIAIRREMLVCCSWNLFSGGLGQVLVVVTFGTEVGGFSSRLLKISRCGC